ncbi:MAG: DUF169 domain-containing protein [Firmicutes bacterium]|nr:DUF169 domain-containing protein [Bacillota bacterium]
MKTEITERLKLKYSPVAVIATGSKPENALEFAEGSRGCVVSLLSEAFKGKQAVFSGKTSGCPGGAVGLGFSVKSDDSIYHYLSTGIEGVTEGNAIKKTPELAKDFIEEHTKIDVKPQEYLVLKPLADVDPEHETPEVVIFLANPDQLSALTVLANYGRKGVENVIIPFASGCAGACRFPWGEVEKDSPRAVIGMIEIPSRLYFDPDILSFSVPYKMMKEMESNISGSFLERSYWKKLVERIPDVENK